MGIKRIVDTSFWTDGKVDEFSPEDKLFMLYLLTSPFSTQLGIYEISIKQVAFHLGYSIDTVEVLLDRFEKKYGVIIYSPSTNEIAIKNFLKHSIVKGGAPVRDCLIKELKNVKNKDLIARVFIHIKDSEMLNETVRNIIDEYEAKNGTLSFSNTKEKESSKEKENQNENDNDNDNENDVSYPVSYHDTYHDTYNESYHDSFDNAPKQKKPSSKPSKHKYGEYKHVQLSDNEHEKLLTEYGEETTQKAITFLDEYIEEKGYKSKSHYLAIRRWVIDAISKGSNSPMRTQQTNNQQQPKNRFLAYAENYQEEGNYYDA